MQTFDEFWDDLVTYDLEYKHTIQKLRACYSYSNGCGSKGGFHFPSTMWGVNIEAACNLHDIEWQLAESYDDLLAANERFDNNLKNICDFESMNGFTNWMRRMRIAKYVSGVELVGTNAYADLRGFDYKYD